MTDNYDGIYSFNSLNNTISGNNITGNSNDGIDLESSSQNTINENNVMGNQYGIYLSNSIANVNFNRIVGNIS
ncbi:MAG: right-handed parallel beta-helix repeat-containing protein [Methanobacterium sp.]|uniref:right-handed parallel beta-helix repeat-containing protein n=1 Tax=Methanobacterium sp. TaxID=2164 RepID=UPI003C712803